MVEEIGLDAVRAKVKRPLTDLRVGPFYGCYIVRPTDRLGIDREHPRDTYLHQLIEALGGTVVDYAGQYKCCGFPIITMNQEASLKQAGRHLGDAIDAEADCLVTPCPLCHLNLDLQQPLAERVVGRSLGMPVLHLPQLVGLAFGLEPKELGHEQARRAPTTVIDWSTSVVAGVGARRSLPPARASRRAPAAADSSLRLARRGSGRAGLAWYAADSLRHRRESGHGYDLRGGARPAPSPGSCARPRR